MTWSWPLPNNVPWEIPSNGHVDAFATEGRFTISTGIDLYCPPGSLVHAVEDGTVLRIEKFTGPKTDSEWFFPTESILIRGPSGVVSYGEIRPDKGIVPGIKVKKGQRIATVLQVRKLHIEMYDYDETTYSQPSEKSTAAWWYRDQPQPMFLRNPTKKLRQAWLQVTDRFHRDQSKPPATPEERRKLVQWILNHKLWTHEHFLRMHAPGQPMFKKIPNSANSLMTEPEGELEDVRSGSFSECVRFDYVYLDPTVERIQGMPPSDEDPRNTDFRVWVEAGGWMDQSEDDNIPPPTDDGWNDYNKWIACHDINLDCSGATTEDALIQLALRVKWYYGEGGRDEERIPRNSERFGGDCGSHFEADAVGDNLGRYYQHCVDAGDGFCVKCGYRIYRCYHTAREGFCDACDEEIMPSSVRDEVERTQEKCGETLRRLRRVEDVNRNDESVRKVASDLYNMEDILKEAGRAAVMTDVKDTLARAVELISVGQAQIARFPDVKTQDEDEE